MHCGLQNYPLRSPWREVLEILGHVVYIGREYLIQIPPKIVVILRTGTYTLYVIHTYSANDNENVVER